jgi:hypothetical protein
MLVQESDWSKDRLDLSCRKVRDYSSSSGMPIAHVSGLKPDTKELRHEVRLPIGWILFGGGWV